MLQGRRFDEDGNLYIVGRKKEMILGPSGENVYPDELEETYRAPGLIKEIAVIGSNAFGVEEFEGRRRHAMEIYLDLVASRRIDVTPILTHRFTLDEWREAFLACGNQGSSAAVKVAIDSALAISTICCSARDR